MFRSTLTRVFGSLAVMGLCIAAINARPDPTPKDKSGKQESAKTDEKPGTEFDKPPAGARLVSLGTLTGQITKSGDGKSFWADLKLGDGKKKELEIHLSANTKIRIAAGTEFDDKGNPHKPKADPKDPDWRLGGTRGMPDDLSSGKKVVVKLIGTKNASWVQATVAIVQGE